MNTLRVKSSLGIFLSLMLFCAPLFAKKSIQKRNEKVTAQYLMLCVCDVSTLLFTSSCIGILLDDCKTSKGRKIGKPFAFALVLMLTLPHQLRSLFNDGKALSDLYKKHDGKIKKLAAN